MQEMFPYIESAQRRARKQKALEEGEAEQTRLSRPRRKAAAPPPGVKGKRAEKRPAPASGRRQPPGEARRGAGASESPPGPPSPAAQKAGRRLFPDGVEGDFTALAENIKVFACPSCDHELVKVVCISTPVRVCPQCKSVWLPYCVVREFAAVNEWFQQLEPSLEMQMRAHRRR